MIITPSGYVATPYPPPTCRARVFVFVRRRCYERNAMMHCRQFDCGSTHVANQRTLRTAKLRLLTQNSSPSAHVADSEAATAVTEFHDHETQSEAATAVNEFHGLWGLFPQRRDPNLIVD